MARRRNHNREEILVMALAAAREIVTLEGAEALSARRVASQIGYSPGTLYNLFKNLDDLILRVNGVTLDQLRRALIKASRPGLPEEVLPELVGAYLTFTTQNRHLWQLLLEQKRPDEMVLPDWYWDKVERTMAVLERVLDPFFGPEKKAECREAARVFWCGLHGIWALGGSGRLDAVTHHTVADLAQSLTRYFLAGMRHQEAEQPAAFNKGNV
ncbi:MAG: TetR/AcrR family transcriptional regulator [Magnetococcales bacterium]|nr:TetR/AcrR family transcriptional regulator [Magnetococcales bacterium]